MRKYPRKKQFKEERVYFSSQLRLVAIVVGKSRKELGVACVEALRGQRSESLGLVFISFEIIVPQTHKSRERMNV